METGDKRDDFIVRKPQNEELVGVMEMIRALYSFENILHTVHLTVEQFVADYKAGVFRCLIVESNTKLVGYALFCDIYMTALGKCLFLEDIFVKEEYRRRGIGRRLFHNIAEDALVNGCVAMKLEFYGWNSNAYKFYKELGGVDVTTENEVHLAKFDKVALEKLCSNNKMRQ